MEINKKSRTELKAYFVKNAIPTENNFRDLIDAALMHKDDGLTKSAGLPLSIEAVASGERPVVHLYDSFTAASPSWVLSLLPGAVAGGKTLGKGLGIGDGAGSAKARLFIEDATGNVSIGAVDPAGFKLNVAGTANVTGTMNVGGLLSPNAGLTVPAGQALISNGSFSANAGATVQGGPLQAKSGATISGAQLQASAGATISGGLLQATSGATISGGLLTAGAGLQVPAGQTFATNGTFSATAGATISGGALYANSGLNVAAGQATVVNGSFSATAGATISGGALRATSGATVTGTLEAGTLSFPAPAGDLAPTISARPVPATQGGTNESTELILFHSNDGYNGAGPDFITLRAPAIRLQTYGDTNVASIDSAAGSNTRVQIEPDGRTLFFGAADIQTATRTGTQGTGLALYVTATCTGSSGLAEFRHSNGTEGIGIGCNTIYAAGTFADQTLTITAKYGISMPNGLHVGSGDRTTHLETDGSIYRFAGQMYITVDDNLYLRNMNAGGGQQAFHFDTANQRLGIGLITPQNKLDIQHGSARSGTHATGVALYVTANSTGSSGLAEFRHLNGTEGIGIGHNTIYATGVWADQSLFIKARGAGRVEITQEAWQTPTLLNGWAHLGAPWSPPGYFKDSLGFVHLRGVFQRGSGQSLFVLPAGYRPPYRELQIGVGADSWMARVEVWTDGTVYMYWGGSNSWLSIDGISFRAA